MPVELVKALMIIARYCNTHGNCKTCALREFCSKQPILWGE